VLDDHSRVAYSEIHDDERDTTAIGGHPPITRLTNLSGQYD